MLRRPTLSAWRITLPQPVLWSPLLGVARTLIALGGLVTVLFTREDYLFRPVHGLGTYPLCGHIDQASLFCVMRDDLGLARIVAAVLLVVVITGFLPQVTSILHAWIAFSVASSISIPEGGDQIAAIMAILLIPVCMTDPRVNHWQSARTGTRLIGARMGAAVVFLIAVKIQLMILYFFSGAGKIYQTEWAEGTAVFYIGQGFFGASGFPLEVLTAVTSTPLGALAASWGTIVLELSLAMLPLLRGMPRTAFALLGVTLHVSIIIFIGLWSFQLIMLGGLLLLAFPVTAETYRAGFSAGDLRSRRLWVRLGMSTTQTCHSDPAGRPAPDSGVAGQDTVTEPAPGSTPAPAPAPAMAGTGEER
jgi:antimicrobial peptide system SdpB family protein